MLICITMQQPLYTAKQAQQMDCHLIEQPDITADQLMQHAAAACLDEIKKRYPQVTTITLLAGGGNNGGDAYALACLLHNLPYTLRVFSLSADRSSQPTAEHARQDYLSLGGSIEATLDQSHLYQTQLIVDAMFGVGLNRPLNQLACDWIQAANQAPAPVLSVDVPSGLDADSGAEMPMAVRADTTVTFVCRKRGLYTAAGKDCCGTIVFDDLLHRQNNQPTDLADPPKPAAWLVGFDDINKTQLKSRLHNSHKNDYGHVVVVGGDLGMGGAAILAAEAALRSGAGVVSLATRPQHLSAALARCPAIMVHAIEHAQQLDSLLERASVIVVGVGLGDSEWSRALCERALASPAPKVMDAGILHYVAQHFCSNPDWILTPHPGEAAALLATTTASVQANRFLAAEQLSKRYGGVCILKGTGSIVCSAERTAVCAAGNPMLATAGSGDVLSGLVGGLCALGLPPMTAAEYAVLIHANAADQIARYGRNKLIATDLLSHIYY